MACTFFKYSDHCNDCTDLFCYLNYGDRDPYDLRGCRTCEYYFCDLGICGRSIKGEIVESAQKKS